MSDVKTDFSFKKLKHGKMMIGFLVLIFLGSVGLDQASKTEVQEKLLISEFDKSDIRTFRGARHSIGSVGNKNPAPDETPFYVGLKFQYSRNPGAAFSMLAELDDSIRVPLQASPQSRASQTIF